MDKPNLKTNKVNQNKRLIVISGATATGKSDIALELAKQLNTVIVSADSRQMFKEMRIGTAVPDNSAIESVKHYFIANKSVTDRVDVYRYEQEAIELLNSLFANYDDVILCGGSVMYVDAVVYGIDELPDPDSAYRDYLQKKVDDGKLSELLAMLKKNDPEYYDFVDKSNPIRVIRGLEVYHAAGKKYSDLRTGHDKIRDFKALKFYVDMPRELIYERINKRVDLMMEAGLLEEVHSLIEYRNLVPLKTVGYRELFKYFDGEWTLEEAVDKIKRNSRRYAKRQLSWLRRDGKYIAINNIKDIIENLKS